MTSEATARANAFVEEHLDEARGLGSALAELTDYPEEFVAVLRTGLVRLADDVYAAEQERVAPGSGVVFGVRSPLLSATMRQIRPALQDGSSATSLWLAERLAVEPEREFVFFCHLALRRALPNDPEQAWQLMRRLARQANDWIRVDSLAAVWARGILLDARRWSELEQLVFSSSSWERRLVGSTIATLPFELPRPRRQAALANTPALELVRNLMGDAAPEVQKALAWALRSWREVDPRAVDELLRAEARQAATTRDGGRAWVIRDALKVQRMPPPAPLAAELRALLAGVRRTPGGESTSTAHEVASRFRGFDALSDAALDVQGDRQRYMTERMRPRTPAGRA